MRVPPKSVSRPLVLAAVLVPALAVAQGGLPQRKAGWWEMAMTMSGPMAMSQTLRMCTDPAKDKPGETLNGGMAQRGACTQGPVTPTPGGWSFSSTCAMGKMTMSTTGLARGDFNSGYHLESTTRMDPAPMPQLAETHMTIDARWLGPCPAGKKPGDVERAR
jgi:hypothetical protein